MGVGKKCLSQLCPSCRAGTAAQCLAACLDLEAPAGPALEALLHHGLSQETVGDSLTAWDGAGRSVAALAGAIISPVL